VIASAAAGLHLDCEIDSEDLPGVRADAGRIELVLRELFADASKFREERVCRIQVWAVSEEGSAVTSVSDNGIGIEPRQSERIFKPLFVCGETVFQTPE
jgi:chemotaxis family two-component system sensor kinase Cph1